MRMTGFIAMSAASVLAHAAFAAEGPAKRAAEQPAAAAAGADEKKSGLIKNEKCPYQEQVTLNVTLAAREKSVREAKTAFDKRIEEVENFARQAGVAKIQVMHRNYNISSQPQYGVNGMVSGIMEYQLNGNVSYQLNDAEVATALMEQLSRQNIQASLNVNAYRNQPCPMM